MGRLSKLQIRNVKDAEKKEFTNLMKMIGFTRDSDFYSFCAAVAFFRISKDPKFEIKRLKKGVNAFYAGSTIRDVKLFESLLDRYFPNCHDDQKKIFENVFYSGFLLISDWWEKDGQNAQSEIERITSLMEYVKEG